MADDTLCCRGGSGNAHKVALLLQSRRLPWRPVRVDFCRGGARTPECRGKPGEMGDMRLLQRAQDQKLEHDLIAKPFPLDRPPL